VIYIIYLLDLFIFILIHILIRIEVISCSIRIGYVCIRWYGIRCPPHDIHASYTEYDLYTYI